MSWIVFSYSLPSKSSSSPRVALWRRLRRLGAISLKGSIHVLPARDECIESFQWLAQEVQQAKGEALVMRVERFEELADQEIIELFRQARREEYAEIDVQAQELEKLMEANANLEERTNHLEILEKLRKQYAEITRLDFFDCPEGSRLAAKLNQIGQTLSRSEPSAASVTRTTIDAYRDRQWVTRPRPHVDRLACIWLIRRFVNPLALIRYSHEVATDEIAFDMKEGDFKHHGNLCTFEVMLAAFGLDDPGLQAVAEIVHEIDLRDGQYVRPEIAGIDALLRGCLLRDLPDAEIESFGVSLFEGLYTTFSQSFRKEFADKKPRNSPKSSL